MKKALVLVLALVFCLAMATFAMAAILSGVAGTPHDARTGVLYQYAGGATHVCENCHTPHSGTQGYPLWNRNRGHEATVFTMYSSPSSDMITANGLLGYQSRLCFACHDGVASTIVNTPGTDNPVGYNLTLAGTANLGTVMTNDHPVGFVFDAVLDTGTSGLSTLATVPTGSTTGITGRVIGSTLAIGFPLFAGPFGDGNTFQCATCHAVHHTPDIGYDTGVDGQVYFLRVSNKASQMCAECHPNYY